MTDGFNRQLRENWLVVEATGEKVTPEFCAGKILVFKPKTIEEAGAIQAALFEFGFSWRSGGDHSIECVELGITAMDGMLYLDRYPLKSRKNAVVVCRLPIEADVARAQWRQQARQCLEGLPHDLPIGPPPQIVRRKR